MRLLRRVFYITSFFPTSNHNLSHECMIMPNDYYGLSTMGHGLPPSFLKDKIDGKDQEEKPDEVIGSERFVLKKDY